MKEWVPDAAGAMRLYELRFGFLRRYFNEDSRNLTHLIDYSHNVCSYMRFSGSSPEIIRHAVADAGPPDGIRFRFTPTSALRFLPNP